MADIEKLKGESDSNIEKHEENKKELKNASNVVATRQQDLSKSQNNLLKVRTSYSNAVAKKNAYISSHPAEALSELHIAQYDHAIEMAKKALDECSRDLREKSENLKAALERENTARDNAETSRQVLAADEKRLQAEIKEYQFKADEVKSILGKRFLQHADSVLQALNTSKKSLNDIRNDVLKSLGYSEVFIDSDDSGSAARPPMLVKKRTLTGVFPARGGIKGNATGNAASSTGGFKKYLLKYKHHSDNSPKAKNKRLRDYIFSHNYTPDDFDIYSKDREWQELHRAAYPSMYSLKADLSTDFFAEAMHWTRTTPFSYSEALKMTNPNYSSGSYSFCYNCQRCVPTYELIRRGCNVTAMPIINIDYDDIAHNPYCVWSDPIIYSSSDSGRAELETALSDWGNGARAQVVFKYDNYPDGHTFIAENINGKIMFIDPQSNQECSHLFGEVESGSLTFARIDNLELNNAICRVASERSIKE